MSMEQGDISAPVRGSSGYHIFLLYERERGGSTAPAFEEVRDQLFRTMLDAAMQRQEGIFLEELRRGAVITRRLAL